MCPLMEFTIGLDSIYQQNASILYISPAVDILWLNLEKQIGSYSFHELTENTEMEQLQ